MLSCIATAIKNLGYEMYNLVKIDKKIKKNCTGV